MSNLTQRLITGIFFVAFIIGAVVWNEYSYMVLFTLIIVLCIWEYQKLIDSRLNSSDNWKKAYRILNVVFSLFIFGDIFLVSSGWVPMVYMSLVAAFPLAWFVIEMYSKAPTPFTNTCYNAMGLFYLAVPLSSASFLVFRGGGYEYKYLLAILFFAWANDSWAYLIGKYFGKTKLFERISPKKTWEGFAGGFVFTILFAFLVDWLMPAIGQKDVNIIHYVAMAVITSVLSTYGDLAESMIKRNLEIKDSGSALPGHGGFLDRFDGLLFALPANTLYITIFHL
ncbi:MAG: phosphatidate cytidylyltransferase [Chitinophagales bacterium]|nr:phosphatidate cytidylyltransferase [Chitinophagales bacterium]